MTAPRIAYDRQARHYEVIAAGGEVLGTFATYQEAADFAAVLMGDAA